MGRERAGWYLLALGITAGLLGRLYSVIALGEPENQIAAPSWDDAGYVVARVLLIAGVLVLPIGSRRPAALTRALLDGVLIGSSLFLVSLTTILYPFVTAGHYDSFGLSLNLIYPTADITAAWVVIVALSRARAPFRPLVGLLAAALLLLAVSDSVVAYLAPIGIVGDISLVPWLLALVLLGVAARLRRPALVVEPRDLPERFVLAAFPYLVLVVAVAMVAVSFLAGGGAFLALRFTAVSITVLTAAALLVRIHDLLESLRQSHSAELALATSQAMIARLLDTAPVALFSVDARGHFVFSRGSAFKVVVDQPEKLEGRRVEEALEDLPEVVAMVRRALAGQRNSSTIVVWPNEIELFCDPVFSASGDVESVTGVAVDVTAQRGIQRAVTESEAKSQLIATVSHELRTPLSSVIGFTELLLRDVGTLTEKQQRYLRYVESSGRHLLHVVNGILDFSKVNSGGSLEVRSASMDACVVVEGVLAKLGPLAGHRSLRFECKTSEEMSVLADPVRVEQILLNLVSNAIKCTSDSGSVVAAGQREGAWISLTVTDDGIGIATEDIERVFEDYAQVEGRAGGGTGLGLPVSRRLAAAMKGTLTVRSELGKGSSFQLLLPAAS